MIVGINAPFRAEGELAGQSAITWQRASISIWQERVLSALSNSNIAVPNIRRFKTIPYMAMEVDTAGLLALQLNSNVTSIVEDKMRYISTASANTVVNAPAAWAAGFDGSGYIVAVLDTGVDFTHPSLTNQRLAEACFSNFWGGGINACENGQKTQFGFGAAMPPSSAVCPDCAHGTHVAGIAAGNGSGQGASHDSFRGVAPGADLIGINVFTLLGGGDTGSYDSDQIAAMEYIYDTLRFVYPDRIAAVNLSLGGNTRYSSESACNADDEGGYYRAAVNNLVSVKIAVIAASGNNGDTTGITAPSCLTNVVSVGATNDSNVVASFSNSAGILDLLAPGHPVTSTIPGGTYLPLQGTSMATPYVAGTWAIMRQAYPNDSVDSILNRLKTNGLLVTDARNNVSTRRINVANSIPTPATIAFTNGISTPSEGQVVNVGINLNVGNGGSNLSSPFTVNLNYTGTASYNVDFTAPMSVTFTRSGGWSPNTNYTAAATIPVTILNDDLARGDVSESIIISFVTPLANSNITVTNPTTHTSIITSTNVQVTGALNFGSSTYTTAEFGSTGITNTIQVPVTMTIANNTSNITSPPTITTNVIYGGSAVQGTDYSVVQSSVTFDGSAFYQGTYTAYIPVNILARSGTQGNRPFTITLQSPTQHPDVVIGGTTPSTTVTIRETTNIIMTENELRDEIMTQLQPTHQINSVIPDFIAGTGINMVVILDDGTVGIVPITLTSQNGANRVVFGDMTVNGQPASDSYKGVINVELQNLIINGINNFVTERTGTTRRIEITQIGASDITFGYVP